MKLQQLCQTFTLLNKFAILLKSINRYQQLQVAAAHPTSK